MRELSSEALLQAVMSYKLSYDQRSLHEAFFHGGSGEFVACCSCRGSGRYSEPTQSIVRRSTVWATDGAPRSPHVERSLLVRGESISCLRKEAVVASAE